MYLMHSDCNHAILIVQMLGCYAATYDQSCDFIVINCANRLLCNLFAYIK